ncbi:hypothetical protein [Kitasatospora sp. NPDC005751]|uniref:hypothetical protein n=1 Tax=Kitasatospora sp. NPDC005751 TaxID=3157064 RepID=UPI0033E6D9B1
MEGQDDVRLEDVVVRGAGLFDNDESFKREQIRFGVAGDGTEPLDRPSVGEICVHCRMVAPRAPHSHSFMAATSTVA